MTFPPFAVARYGVWLALAVGVLSAWLGIQAGATLDYALMRAVFVFIVFIVLAFGAEAILTIGVQPVQAPADEPQTGEHHD